MSDSGVQHAILVAVDGSAESHGAVRWAAHEAVLRQVPLTLVHVIPPVKASWPAASLQNSYNEWQEENAQQVLEQARETLRASVGESTPPEVNTKVVHSHVMPGLVEASRSAQLIVVGSRGLGAIGRVVLGSVSSGLAHHARCPVAVIHHDGPEPDRTAPILLGVDGSATSEQATALAFDEADRRGVGLIALHAWSDVLVVPDFATQWKEFEDDAAAVLAEQLAGWQDRYPDVAVDRRVVCDEPARRLIEASDEAQLVVVGSHGRGGFQGMLLGSVSRSVVHGAKVPVLVVRS